MLAPKRPRPRSLSHWERGARGGVRDENLFYSGDNLTGKETMRQVVEFRFRLLILLALIVNMTNPIKVSGT